MSTDDNVQLYLASTSPRRRELLERMGLRFATLFQDVDESRRDGEGPEDYVRRMALEKAAAGLRRRPAGDTAPVLGADTAVQCDGRLLGKPADRDAGLAMLEHLSGTTHQVLSAVALDDGGRRAVRVSRTQVEFRTLTPGEMVAYWNTGEPADKAGGYAIQGVGALFVRDLHGSYSGVMGLPVFETADLLAGFGLDVETMLKGYRE